MIKIWFELYSDTTTIDCELLSNGRVVFLMWSDRSNIGRLIRDAFEYKRYIAKYTKRIQQRRKLMDA